MRIIYNSKSFSNYLGKFVFDEKPFKCPYLKVLPESLEVKEGNSIFVYEKRTLICSAKTGSIGITKSHGCSAGGEQIRLDEEGSMEVTCDWNGSRFILKLEK